MSNRFALNSVSWDSGRPPPMRLRRLTLRSIDNPGRFKKGHLPQTVAPEGDRTVRCRFDNRKVPQLMIRLKLDHWAYLSHYVWETFFGPIPAGQLVTFIDGNTLNCHPDNLRLISRQENLRRNKNPAKAAKTLKRRRAANGVDNPSLRLSDSFVLSTISRDPVVQELIKTRAPELIDLKRQLLRQERGNKPSSS